MTSSLPLHVTLPITPVPAPRPRVTRWGTYYGKRYTAFRQEASKVIDDQYAGTALSGALEVMIWFYCQKPKTTKRDCPRGDVDNYTKAILDSCNGKVWEDDTQIINLVARKRWEDEYGPRIELLICRP